MHFAKSNKIKSQEKFPTHARHMVLMMTTDSRGWVWDLYLISSRTLELNVYEWGSHPYAFSMA